MRDVPRRALRLALVLALAAPAVHAADQTCVTIEGVMEDLDAYGFWIAPQNQRVEEVGCHCDGSCLAPRATFGFQDRSANAISLTGGGDLACSVGTSNTTYVTTDSGDGDRDLVTGEGLAFNVTNTPATHDKVTLCVKFSPL